MQSNQYLLIYWRRVWLHRLLVVCKAGSFLFLYNQKKNVIFGFFLFFLVIKNYLAKKWRGMSRPVCQFFNLSLIWLISILAINITLAPTFNCSICVRFPLLQSFLLFRDKISSGVGCWRYGTWLIPLTEIIDEFNCGNSSFWTFNWRSFSK